MREKGRTSIAYSYIRRIVPILVAAIVPRQHNEGCTISQGWDKNKRMINTVPRDVRYRENGRKGEGGAGEARRGKPSS